MKKLLLTTLTLVTIAAYQPTIAHEGKDDHNHAKPAAEATQLTSKATSIPEALSEVQAGMKSISRMVEAGKLDTIHTEIEKLEPALDIIRKNSALTGEKKTRLESSLSQLTSQLGKLHTVADSKDISKTKAELKKAEGALKLVESALK